MPNSRLLVVLLAGWGKLYDIVTESQLYLEYSNSHNSTEIAIPDSLTGTITEGVTLSNTISDMLVNPGNVTDDQLTDLVYQLDAVTGSLEESNNLVVGYDCATDEQLSPSNIELKEFVASNTPQTPAITWTLDNLLIYLQSTQIAAGINTNSDKQQATVRGAQSNLKHQSLISAIESLAQLEPEFEALITQAQELNVNDPEAVNQFGDMLTDIPIYFQSQQPQTRVLKEANGLFADIPIADLPADILARPYFGRIGAYVEPTVETKIAIQNLLDALASYDSTGSTAHLKTIQSLLQKLDMEAVRLKENSNIVYFYPKSMNTVHLSFHWNTKPSSNLIIAQPHAGKDNTQASVIDMMLKTGAKCAFTNAVRPGMDQSPSKYQNSRDNSDFSHSLTPLAKTFLEKLVTVLDDPSTIVQHGMGDKGPRMQMQLFGGTQDIKEQRSFRVLLALALAQKNLPDQSINIGFNFDPEHRINVDGEDRPMSGKLPQTFEAHPFFVVSSSNANTDVLIRLGNDATTNNLYNLGLGPNDDAVGVELVPAYKSDKSQKRQVYIEAIKLAMHWWQHYDPAQHNIFSRNFKKNHPDICANLRQYGSLFPPLGEAPAPIPTVAATKKPSKLPTTKRPTKQPSTANPTTLRPTTTNTPTPEPIIFQTKAPSTKTPSVKPTTFPSRAPASQQEYESVSEPPTTQQSEGSKAPTTTGSSINSWEVNAGYIEGTERVRTITCSIGGVVIDDLALNDEALAPFRGRSGFNPKIIFELKNGLFTISVTRPGTNQPQIVRQKDGVHGNIAVTVNRFGAGGSVTKTLGSAGVRRTQRNR